jgi:hypothetical protein
MNNQQRNAPIPIKARTQRQMDNTLAADLSVPELADYFLQRLRKTNGGDFMTDTQRANLMLALFFRR